jgi:hypothetical protein
VYHRDAACKALDPVQVALQIWHSVRSLFTLNRRCRDLLFVALHIANGANDDAALSLRDTQDPHAVMYWSTAQDMAG